MTLKDIHSLVREGVTTRLRDSLVLLLRYGRVL